MMVANDRHHGSTLEAVQVEHHRRYTLEPRNVASTCRCESEVDAMRAMGLVPLPLCNEREVASHCRQAYVNTNVDAERQVDHICETYL